VRRLLHNAALKDERGFTLVELLVTMVMMLLVMSALYGIFDMGIKVYTLGNDKVNAVENARIALDRMSREIRAAYPADKANDGNSLFLSAEPDRVTFGNDLNGDRRVTCSDPSEYITYSLSGTTLMRSTNCDGSGAHAVAEHIKDLTFRYYAADGSELDPTDPGFANEITKNRIAVVQITLTAEVSHGSLGTSTQTLTTDVTLQNGASQ
jgi:prepilin-type N-terminal cleavage/methylation domain-containing protein